MESSSASRYLPNGRYHQRLPFITPEERAQIEARQLEEISSSSSDDDCPVPCPNLISGNPGGIPTSRTTEKDVSDGGNIAQSGVKTIGHTEAGVAATFQVDAAPHRESDPLPQPRSSHADIADIVVAPILALSTLNIEEEEVTVSSKGKGKEVANNMADPDASGASELAGPAVTTTDKNIAAGLKKVKKQKVLLMGKSGSGKSSMRSIIFSNYLARDTRRLGATIDIDLSHVKFLGNLTLNLWDCGGQEAFMENYLSQQRAHVFSNVGVLIYVFDIESRDVERDLATYVNIASALFQYSREAKIFVLVHKMDLIQPSTREDVFDNRVAAIRKKTAEAVAIVRKQKPETAAVTSDADLEMQAFATSIWDQSLYKAWASIIHDLVPNLALIEEQLANLGGAIDAEEILLFERTSFLVVSKWSSDEGECNPFGDRFERLSNILKSWKHTCSKFTGTPRNAEQFTDFEYKAGANFALFITKFTTNTYILVCMPPGEARFNSAKLNVSIARSWFRFLDGPIAAPTTAAVAPAAVNTTAATSSSGPSQSTAVTSASGSGADFNSGPSSET